MSDTEHLQAEIRRLKLENTSLRERCSGCSSTGNQSAAQSSPHHLSLQEYRRYGRQMQVPEFGGLTSQERLKSSSALIIGAGGLGSPALLYLAAAGIGRIGIVDHDVVDTTNLHRQIIHDTDTVNINKAESAKIRINALNPNVEVTTYCEPITNTNSFKIVKDYDIVLDCSDNPATRYLINDTCVKLDKTFVSGSGLRTEGQLTVLNFHRWGPCYRCFFPTPPPPNTVTSCSDGGVIGPCIGITGVMMAVEAIKVLTDYYTDDNFKPFLTVYNGYPQQKLRTFKMRGRVKGCKACDSDEITKEDIESGEVDYEGWCGSMNYNVLDSAERINVRDFSNEWENDKNINPLIDVRAKEQYEIAHLSGSINIPYSELSREVVLPECIDPKKKTYVICRFGRDSQLSTRLLKEKLSDVKDVIGGLDAWKKEVDEDFPAYW
ncbi:DEKNAAC101572 [Brettanomyces naardenensis]|uniref:DEKNAAC101572 n=1 Tax=Brettanomyces naardenensis TaxID=13370 RepID=A0A448YIG7_BRENA|nr:DEKNAAC101572 [Brettanomyces naardenensis]